MQALKTHAQVHDLMEETCTRVVYCSDAVMLLEPKNQEAVNDAVALLKGHNIDAEAVPTKDGRRFISVAL